MTGVHCYEGRDLETVCGGTCGLAGPHLFWIPVNPAPDGPRVLVQWGRVGTRSPAGHLGAAVGTAAAWAPTWAGPLPQPASRQWTWHRYAVVTRQ